MINILTPVYIKLFQPNKMFEYQQEMGERSAHVSQFLLSYLEKDFDRVEEILRSQTWLNDIFQTPADGCVKDKIKSMTHEQAADFTVKAYSRISFNDSPKYKVQTMLRAMEQGLNDGGVLKLLGVAKAESFMYENILIHFVNMFTDHEDLLAKMLSLMTTSTEWCEILALNYVDVSHLLTMVISWPNTERQTGQAGICLDHTCMTELDTMSAEKLLKFINHLLGMYEKQSTTENLDQSHALNCMYENMTRWLRDVSFTEPLSLIPNRQRIVVHILKSVIHMKGTVGVSGMVARELMHGVVYTSCLSDKHCIDVVDKIISLYKNQEDFKDTNTNTAVVYAAGSLRCDLLKYFHQIDGNPIFFGFGASNDKAQTPLMSALSLGAILRHQPQTADMWTKAKYVKNAEQQLLNTIYFIMSIPVTDVNAIDEEGNSALLYMLQQRMFSEGTVIELWKCFIQHNVKLSRREYAQLMPQLLKATERNEETFNNSLLSLLLEYKNFDVNFCHFTSGATLLMEAASSNSSLLEVLLKDSRVNKAAECESGRTCLFYACHGFQPNLVFEKSEQLRSFEKLLADVDIDPTHVDKTKQTVLQYILKIEDTATRNEYLTRLLVHPNLQNLNYQDKNGDTALHIMINAQEYNIVQNVLELKKVSDCPVRLDIQNNQSRDMIDELLLKSMGEAPYVAILKLVTEQPNAPINCRYSGGKTLLMKVCSHGCDTAVSFLLESEGIDLNIKDDRGYTAIMYGINQLQYETILKFLLNPACDMTIKKQQRRRFAADD